VVNVFICYYCITHGCCDAPISLNGLVLPERQFKIVELLVKGIKDVDSIALEMGVNRSDIMRDLAELQSKNLLITSSREYEIFVPTEEGLRYVKIGLPEERLLKVLEKIGDVSLDKIGELAKQIDVELKEEEIKIGIIHLLRYGIVKVEKGILSLMDKSKTPLLLEKCESLRRGILNPGNAPNNILRELKRRGLLKRKIRKSICIEPTEKLLDLFRKRKIKPAKVVTELTSDIIRSGAWRTAIFKPYDLKVEVPTVYPGRKQPYMELLEWIREILVSMGFEEIKGPYVELELWNFDVLFQAQDHPAREIHDTFFVRDLGPGTIKDKVLLERIKSVHEDGWITGSIGWRYKWSIEKAMRLILRTQTTAVSVRELYKRGDGEYRCFSLDRVFRPETLDPRHAMEFYQLEGIIVGKRVKFKHLLGFFNEFARRLGLGRVKIKPAYFPFTEPSVEGFIKHPELGWIEVFPGGMFRPEVLLPLGIRESKVAAWGIGIDRIAMTILGIDDIRDLFSQDIEVLRRMKVPMITSVLG